MITIKENDNEVTANIPVSTSLSTVLLGAELLIETLTNEYNVSIEEVLFELNRIYSRNKGDKSNLNN